MNSNSQAVPAMPTARPHARVGPRASRWPARLDWLQSGSGLLLALFMWVHMFFVSSILLGKDAMWIVTKFFEGYFIFGRSFPWLVSMLVAAIFSLLVLHALLALRKFPSDQRQVRAFRDHASAMQHSDTSLWWWQVVTGFALFFLVSIHLYAMLTRPESIGPYGSADRVWSDHFWPLYLVLLFAVELHGGIGLYRLAVKWGWFAGPNPNATRKRLKTLKWALTGFFLVLGLATLAAYIRIGIEHAPHAGEPYTPAWVQPAAGPAR
ncbi:MAG: fumarate reductase cytochrome b subunit [Burkholderiales bacterium]|nr:fumarate reductase cytochrome b subunit [Burkholderiales bacterium]